MAHLLRRAGFGAGAEELDSWCALGYQNAVETLLNPAPDASPYGSCAADDVISRYLVASAGAQQHDHGAPAWAWRLYTSPRPLEEKIALFWHGLFATGGTKYPMHARGQLAQIEMFRRFGLGSFERLLLELSRDPAMLVWLDNQHNHKDAPNENYGRELLELFSMGRGNYTEDDVKAAARAFTGWTFRPMGSYFFLGPLRAEFHFDPDDHDDGEKTFLGRTGAFDGHDIIAIIVAQPATAHFLCRRLYQFFAADSPGADGEVCIENLTEVFRASGYEIRAVLRALFLSEHFAAMRYRKVKSPAELVFGTARLTRRWTIPDHDFAGLAPDVASMGQTLLNPPSVEGWHEGEEWIDSACLVERINFASAALTRRDAPGVACMLTRIRAAGPRLRSAALLDACLGALGSIELTQTTREVLIDHVSRQGPIDFEAAGAEHRAVELLAAIVSTADYQYC
ncbi:MAG: DUF1800 domain-containing protein [Pseudonocardiaceae bacterium]